MVRRLAPGGRQTLGEAPAGRDFRRGDETMSKIVTEIVEPAIAAALCVALAALLGAAW